MVQYNYYKGILVGTNKSKIKYFVLIHHCKYTLIWEIEAWEYEIEIYLEYM